MLHLIFSIFKNVDRRTLILGGAETLIIIVLSAKIIFNSPVPEIKTIDNSRIYQDSIRILLKKFDVLRVDVDKKTASFDSLVQVKNKVEIVTQTKIKYVTKANTTQLDSIIRKGW